MAPDSQLQKVSEMRNKGIQVFEVLFFGVTGVTILVLAFVLEPMQLLDRVFTILVGSTGLCTASIRSLKLRFSANKHTKDE